MIFFRIKIIRVLDHLYARSDHTAIEVQAKDPSDVNNYWPIAIATGLSKVLEQVLLSIATRQVPVHGLQTANLVSSKHMGQKWSYLHSSKQ